MFAVIKTGGKQYKVQTGDVLQVEKLDVKEGQKISFDQVLLIDDEERTLIGTPYLENAQVRAEVLENFKDKKVIVFKKKKRKQYRKKTGHRQELTRVRIEEIIPDLKTPPKKTEEKVKAAEVPRKIKPKKEVKPKVAKEEKPKKAEEVKRKTKVTRQAKVSGARKSEVKAPAKKKPKTKTASKA